MASPSWIVMNDDSDIAGMSAASLSSALRSSLNVITGMNNLLTNTLGVTFGTPTGQYASRTVLELFRMRLGHDRTQCSFVETADYLHSCMRRLTALVLAAPPSVVIKEYGYESPQDAVAALGYLRPIVLAASCTSEPLRYPIPVVMARYPTGTYTEESCVHGEIMSLEQLRRVAYRAHALETPEHVNSLLMGNLCITLPHQKWWMS